MIGIEKKIDIKRVFTLSMNDIEIQQQILRKGSSSYFE